MTQKDPFDGDVPEGLEEIEEAQVDGTEVTVYEWTLYRNGAPERSGRCVGTETHDRAVSTISISSLSKDRNMPGGGYIDIVTYHSNTFVLGREDNLHVEPDYTMTVHPDDVDGEFVDL